MPYSLGIHAEVAQDIDCLKRLRNSVIECYVVTRVSAPVILQYLSPAEHPIPQQLDPPL